MAFTKEFFKNIRKDIDKALEEVGKKYDISLTSGNISYSENEFSIKIDAKRTDIDVDRLNFENDLQPWSFGQYFTKEDYGRIFTDGKRTMKLIGFKPGNKYSVIAEDTATGQQRAYTIDYAVELINGGK